MRLVRVLAVFTWFVVAAGCAKTLFPPNEPRTPYQRYQQLHGQSRSVTETNAYGGEQPALRDRLKPLDQP